MSCISGALVFEGGYKERIEGFLSAFWESEADRRRELKSFYPLSGSRKRIEGES